MKIPSQAYLDNANHGFAAGVRTATAALLVQMGEDVLADEVLSATGQNMLDDGVDN
jgi:hypothetical protein